MERNEEPTRRTARDAGAAREELERGAQHAARAAEARASSAIDERKRAAADGVERTASTLRSAAEQMRERDSRGLASLVEDVAGRMDVASRRLREESVDSLVASATELARRQPGAFFGASVAAGFALSRFLKASASRRQESRSFETRGGTR